jgi:hypothetical protein
MIKISKLNSRTKSKRISRILKPRKSVVKLQTLNNLWSVDYGKDWDQQKKLAKKRDNNKCRKCGKRHKKGSPPFHVHHIRSRRKMGSNALSNLLTLCEKCHKSLHPHMGK